MLYLTSLALAVLAVAPIAEPASDQAGIVGTCSVDLDGRVHALGVEGRPVALVFLGTECPVSNRYAPRLNELAQAAAAKHVAFFGVVSEASLTAPGKATTDRSALALYFADEPVERHVEGLVIGTKQIDIAPGDDEFGRYVWMELPADAQVIDVTPHVHYLGREVEAYATPPDGTQEPLIHIPDWDFRWQDTYVFREPVHLPAGTLIEALFRFDNSEKNPFNPSSPPRRVREGWQTTDETCLFYFSLVPDDPKQAGAIQRAAFQSFLRPSNP